MHPQSLTAAILTCAIVAGSGHAQSWDQLVARQWPGDTIKKVTETEFEVFMHHHVARLGGKGDAVRAFLTAQHRAYGYPATGDLWFINTGRPMAPPRSVADNEVQEGPEPNDDPNNGGVPTPLPCIQGHGVIDPPGTTFDNDWWEFWVNTPTKITLFTARGTSASSGYVTDTVLELYDSTSTLITADDDGGPGLYSLIVITLQPGQYFANVRPFSTSTTVGSYTIDRVCEPPDPPRTQTQEGPEPNNDPNSGGTPTVTVVPSDNFGDVNPSGDSDWWEFTVAGPLRIRGETAAGVGGSAIGDSTLRLWDNAGNQLAFDDDGGPGLYSLIAYDLPAAGTYFFDVRGFGSRTGDYRLSISEDANNVVANYSTDSTGCAGSNGTPTIASRFAETPRVGTVFTVDVTGLPSSALTAGNLGFTQQIGSITLPIDLAALGAPGCLWSCDVAAVFPLPADAAGDATWFLQIPLDHNLLGVTFYQQSINQDLGANPLGLTTSNLGTGRIGNLIQ